MKIKNLFSAIFFVACAGSAHALTATSCSFLCPPFISDGSISVGGSSNSGDGGSTSSTSPATGASLTVTVNGDLYLDYSIFGGGITIGGNANLSASNNISIDSPDFPSLLPITYSVYTFVDSDTTFNNAGTWVLFSDTPRSSGTFSATNIHIGNYSALAPVPLPASSWLFFAALNVPALLRLKKSSV